MAISMKTLSDMLYIKGAISVIRFVDINSGYRYNAYIAHSNYCYRYFNIKDIILHRSVEYIMADDTDREPWNIPKCLIYNISCSEDIKPVAIEESNDIRGIGILQISYDKINDSEIEMVLSEKECNKLLSRRLAYNTKTNKYHFVKANPTEKTNQDCNPTEGYTYYISELKYNFPVDRTITPDINVYNAILPKIYGKHGYSAGGFWDFIATGDPWQRQ